jgi:hypothetical protein
MACDATEGICYRIDMAAVSQAIQFTQFQASIDLWIFQLILKSMDHHPWLKSKRTSNRNQGFANHDAIQQHTCSVSKQFDFRNALTVPLNVGYTPQSMAAMGKVIF